MGAGCVDSQEPRRDTRAAVTVGNRDDGSNDLLLSETLSGNEPQVWFLAEHLVNVPVVQLDQPRGGSGDAHVDR